MKENVSEKYREKAKKTDLVSKNDPLGSYTGNAFMTDEPEQDADDL